MKERLLEARGSASGLITKSRVQRRPRDHPAAFFTPPTNKRLSYPAH